MDVNLLKPLVRDRKFLIANEDLWIPLKYEKLLKFCFGCGRIMHTNDGCLEKELAPKDQFGGFFKVETLRKNWWGSGGSRPKIRNNKN